MQYDSSKYTALPIEHGIRISMSRPGNPYDNALAESFIKTVKYEEAYRRNIAIWWKPALRSRVLWNRYTRKTERTSAWRR